VQLPSGQLRRDVRSAEGPATAEREVEAKPEVVRPLGSEAEVRQKGIRTELGGGWRQWVDIGHLDAGESSVGHGGQLALQLASAHRRTEPPPAHQRRCTRRRVGKPRAEIIDTYGPRPPIPVLSRKRFLIT
jgi:hypothetical protein